jgi:hypothetical protein
MPHNQCRWLKSKKLTINYCSLIVQSDQWLASLNEAKVDQIDFESGYNKKVIYLLLMLIARAIEEITWRLPTTHNTRRSFRHPFFFVVAWGVYSGSERHSGGALICYT